MLVIKKKKRNKCRDKILMNGTGRGQFAWDQVVTKTIRNIKKKYI